MLRREHRRGHEDGHLHAVGDGLERRAQRDLGLAVADVADHQPVHRPPALQVGLDLRRRPQLVDRLLVREGGLHLLLPRAVGRDRPAVRPLARRVQLEQLLGQVGDRLADARLGALPLAAAEARQVRVLAAGVARDALDLLDRHPDAAALGEMELEEVALLAARRHRRRAASCPPYAAMP